MTSANDFMPKKLTIPSLRAAAKNCQGCSLYKKATQTVFGEGSSKARLIVVGEIPGLKEDEAGQPFVGPAGIFLRTTIEKSNLDFEDIYFTNVVKHFKFIYKGSKKLHRSPIGSEIKACIPWLEAEIKLIQPQVILCLGAIAAKSLVNKNFHLNQQRGKWFSYLKNSKVMTTFHPAALLRIPDETTRHLKKKIFINDVKKVARFLANQP